MSLADLVTRTSGGFYGAFGETALVDGWTIRVVFHESFRTISPFSGEMETTAPFAVAESTDVTEYGITSGTVLTLRDTDYSVTSAQPDGTGTTVLILTKA